MLEVLQEALGELYVRLCGRMGNGLRRSQSVALVLCGMKKAVVKDVHTRLQGWTCAAYVLARVREVVSAVGGGHVAKTVLLELFLDKTRCANGS